MLHKELIEILNKYSKEGSEQIKNVNININNIILQLSDFRDILTKQLQELLCSNMDTDILYADIKKLNEQISNMETIPVNISSNQSNEMSEEIGYPIFDKKVYPYLISDDICPFCNVKLSEHTIYYQRIANNKLNDETVTWYKCKACNRLFALDFDIKGFDFENTNILLNKDKYDEIPQIDIYSVIVLNNTLKCSSNHKTKDIIAKLPVLNEEGAISYLKVNASYCFNCNRFTILKNDFNAIKDVIIGKVIDETYDSSQNNNNNFEMEHGKSILSQYGYNVQTKKDLSEQQRHIILSSLIEAHIMERRDVINHINTLIERGTKIPTWKVATQKWKDDKQFVSEYKSDTLPEIIFNNIILRYKK